MGPKFACIVSSLANTIMGSTVSQDKKEKSSWETEEDEDEEEDEHLDPGKKEKDNSDEESDDLPDDDDGDDVDDDDDEGEEFESETEDTDTEEKMDAEEDDKKEGKALEKQNVHRNDDNITSNDIEEKDEEDGRDAKETPSERKESPSKKILERDEDERGENQRELPTAAAKDEIKKVENSNGEGRKKSVVGKLKEKMVAAHVGIHWENAGKRNRVNRKDEGTQVDPKKDQETQVEQVKELKKDLILETLHVVQIDETPTGLSVSLLLSTNYHHQLMSNVLTMNIWGIDQKGIKTNDKFCVADKYNVHGYIKDSRGDFPGKQGAAILVPSQKNQNIESC